MSLPRFSRIKADQIVQEVQKMLDRGQDLVQRIASCNEPASWESVILPLERFDLELSNFWSPISHLWSVMNTPELSAAFQESLPLISAFETECGQNRQLFEKYKTIYESDDFQTFPEANKQLITNALRDFHLSGVALPQNERESFKACSSELSKTQAKFEQNLLEAGNAWEKLVPDEQILKGVPKTAMELFKSAANQKGKKGWLLTLDFPFYLPIMKYAENRDLRHELYRAFSTRASEFGLSPEKWDNTPLINRILALRHQMANLLSFPQYASFSLATKMADSPEHVLSFLEELAAKGKDAAEREMNELKQYIADNSDLQDCQPWDIPFYSEKLKQEMYAFSSEDLRPFFPLDAVLKGLFDVVEKLFDIQVTEGDALEMWHEDARFFELKQKNGQVQGQFYLDLYARPKKRGGAWMDTCRDRFRNGLEKQNPVAFLTCNFSPPVGHSPSLLTHDEVLTLFHEFGHGLHHMLTKVDFPSVSGINGVPWDAVELPSQFLENWCWQEEALNLFTRHYESGKKLPEDLLQKMKKAKNFQAGMQLVRQLEFALFDFQLHLEYQPDMHVDVMSMLEKVRKRVAVFEVPEWNRFPHSFHHVFGGGYAAGYYSYKWAEVLSADAFSLFQEKGIFDPETGLSFKQHILEKGGSRPAMDLFTAFRGRAPEVEALLRDCGLIEN